MILTGSEAKNEKKLETLEEERRASVKFVCNEPNSVVLVLHCVFLNALEVHCICLALLPHSWLMCQNQHVLRFEAWSKVFLQFVHHTKENNFLVVRKLICDLYFWVRINERAKVLSQSLWNMLLKQFIFFWEDKGRKLLVEFRADFRRQARKELSQGLA